MLVFDDLLHGPARADCQALKLDLHERQAVDQQDDVVAVMAAPGIDTQLADHFETVLAPVLEVDQLIVQRGAVIALEGIAMAKVFGAGENIRADDLIEQAGKLVIGESDAVERLELLAEILLQCLTVVDVRTVAVFEFFQLPDQPFFDLLFFCHSQMRSPAISFRMR